MQHRALLACVLLASTVGPTAGTAGQATTTFKNIKVLTGLGDDEIENAMLYIRGSLGVECEHCHTRNDWSEDDKKAKQTARRMIRRPGRDVLHVSPRPSHAGDRVAAAARSLCCRDIRRREARTGGGG